MTVFITIPWFLPAFRAGGPIQSVANLIDNFNEGIEYRIFCRDTDLNGEALSGIEKNKWTVFNSYTQVWYAEKDDLSKVICEEIEIIQPDVLYIIGLFSWHFNIVPMLYGKANRKIVSVRGMLHPGALSQKKTKKRIFLTALKMFGAGKQFIFHATDAREELFIKNEFGLGTKVIVADNFAKKMSEQLPLEKTTGALTMVTIALISPMKNHLLVLQALKNCNAHIEYNIYGPVKDERYWQQCGELISALPKNINVVYHGEIAPDNIETILAQQHLFIMPSKSENFGHALAEALAAGKPIITSHHTPWNNLESHRAGMNVDLDAKAIAHAINYFAAQDQHAYNYFVNGAIQYSKQKNCDTEKVIGYQKLFSLKA